MTGTVAILNVAAGDTKLTFDPSKPGEAKKSARIVKDMIRRGFVLLIEVGEDDKGPIYRRAHDFDEATSEYIVAGMASDAEEQPDEQKPASTPKRGRKAASKPVPSGHRTPQGQRVPARSTRAVAVSRTAGG